MNLRAIEHNRFSIAKVNTFKSLCKKYNNIRVQVDNKEEFERLTKIVNAAGLRDTMDRHYHDERIVFIENIHEDTCVMYCTYNSCNYGAGTASCCDPSQYKNIHIEDLG
jgi:hypothetical protein